MAARLEPGTGPLGRAGRRARPAYLHMALIIMSRAATWPGREDPFPPQALDLARQPCEATARRVDALGRPPRPDVQWGRRLCAVSARSDGRGGEAGWLPRDGQSGSARP
jgi:hypothetical protein